MHAAFGTGTTLEIKPETVYIIVRSKVGDIPEQQAYADYDLVVYDKLALLAKRDDASAPAENPTPAATSTATQKSKPWVGQSSNVRHHPTTTLPAHQRQSVGAFHYAQ